MIQLHVAEASPEGMNNVLQVIVCVLDREELFCASYVCRES
jgi:hypothetical protein